VTRRRKFSDQFKAKIALEALRGARTIQEIGAKHQLHPTQVSTWKKQAVEGLPGVFSGDGKIQGPSESEIKDLSAKNWILCWPSPCSQADENHGTGSNLQASQHPQKAP